MVFALAYAPIAILLVNAMPSHAAVAQAPRPGQDLGLRFSWQNGRLVAIVDPALLTADLRLNAEIVTVAPATTAALPATAGSVPVVGTRLVSGALRLRREGDLVVVSEYVGRVQDGLQYRRRGAAAVLRAPAGRGIVIDGAKLWETLALETPPAAWGGVSSMVNLDGAPTHRVVARRRSRDATMMTRRLGAYVVTYAVDILRLPKIPIMARRGDPRISFSTTEAGYITRFRLEKRDTTAAVSDVVQPIVVYIDESVPKQWVLYFKQGAEAWNPAFEALGYRNAIKVLAYSDSQPSTSMAQVYMTWDEDGNGGVTTGFDSDPRSGEILRASLVIHSSGNPAYSTIAARYFPPLGVRDPQATLSWPDSITGKAIRGVAAHEIGHTLGFGHNFQIDGYPTDSLRSLAFVRRMSFVPSVTSYSFINFVAQPEDSIPFDLLVPRLGAYDRWALGWGYRPIPGAKTTEDELPTLERWRVAQDTFPYLRVSIVEPTWVDPQYPYYQQGMVGGDILKSVDYGLRNIKHLLDARPTLTSKERSALRRWWTLLLNMVPPLIGGTIPQSPFLRDSTKEMPIDSAYQLRAMRFVLSHMFYGQDDLVSQMLVAAPKGGGDSTLVLFNSLAPLWRVSEANPQFASKPMQTLQEEMLTWLAEKRLPRLAQRNQPGTLAALCKEIAMLDRRLSAMPRDTNSAVVTHLNALSTAVARAFEPGPCKKTP